MADLVVCSHRGPFVFRRVHSRFDGQRGGGGLIGAVAPVLERLGGTWIAAAMSPTDHEVARREPRGRDVDGFRLRLLDLPEDLHALHYDVVSNEYLWFLFHYLFDVPSRPVFGPDFERAWDAYREINRRYADAVADAGRADAILIEDYHLLLVGAELRRRRIRRPLLYFHHTPWCEPDYLSLFPDAIVHEILSALLAHDVVGFHCRRWADAFGRCCTQVLGARTAGDEITWKRRTTSVVVAPVPLDEARLREQARSSRTGEWRERIEAMRDGRRLLVRIDRIDLSKNPLRGYLAFESLLERRPQLAEDVLFLALQYPSRLKVEKYRRYFADCMQIVQRINERFQARAPGEEGPVGLHFGDDFDRSLAAMRSYDALLVNPIFDGLNLVSKEGTVVNDRSGALILSHNAGAWEELGDAAIGVNPFDISATAVAIETALEMPEAERRRRARRLAKLAARSTPEGWAAAQLDRVGVSL